MNCISSERIHYILQISDMDVLKKDAAIVVNEDNIFSVNLSCVG